MEFINRIDSMAAASVIKCDFLFSKSRSFSLVHLPICHYRLFSICSSFISIEFSFASISRTSFITIAIFPLIQERSLYFNLAFFSISLSTTHTRLDAYLFGLAQNIAGFLCNNEEVIISFCCAYKLVL